MILSLNQIGQPDSLVLFVVPYLAACIFFCNDCLYRHPQPGNVYADFCIYICPFIIYLRISWKGAAIPPFLKYVSYIFPSTFGINGFVKINNMGATLSEVAFEYKGFMVTGRHLLPYHLLGISLANPYEP